MTRVSGFLDITLMMHVDLRHTRHIIIGTPIVCYDLFAVVDGRCRPERDQPESIGSVDPFVAHDCVLFVCFGFVVGE